MVAILAIGNQSNLVASSKCAVHELTVGISSKIRWPANICIPRYLHMVRHSSPVHWAGVEYTGAIKRLFHE